MSSVLLVGDDELLLQTRSAVVRTTGAETLCCSASSALAVQAERQCDLVILCHSLSGQLSASLAETVHARWPKTRVIQVTSSRIWEHADLDDEIATVASFDPEALVLRTVELLGRKGPGKDQPTHPMHSSQSRFSA